MTGLTGVVGTEQWRAASKEWTIRALVPTAYPYETVSVSSGLGGRDAAPQHQDTPGRTTMLASESVLRREWDSPEEDVAWADL